MSLLCVNFQSEITKSHGMAVVARRCDHRDEQDASVKKDSATACASPSAVTYTATSECEDGMPYTRGGE
eukprot:2652684-Pleurochrysis_carterae.AAC.1